MGRKWGRLTVFIVFGAVASVLALVAGILVVSSDDYLWIGLGVYFIAKGFFLGPVLWLMAVRVLDARAA